VRLREGVTGNGRYPGQLDTKHTVVRQNFGARLFPRLYLPRDELLHKMRGPDRANRGLKGGRERVQAGENAKEGVLAGLNGQNGSGNLSRGGRIGKVLSPMSVVTSATSQSELLNYLRGSDVQTDADGLDQVGQVHEAGGTRHGAEVVGAGRDDGGIVLLKPSGDG